MVIRGFAPKRYSVFRGLALVIYGIAPSVQAQQTRGGNEWIGYNRVINLHFPGKSKIRHDSDLAGVSLMLM